MKFNFPAPVLRPILLGEFTAGWRHEEYDDVLGGAVAIPDGGGGDQCDE